MKSADDMTTRSRFNIFLCALIVAAFAYYFWAREIGDSAPIRLSPMKHHQPDRDADRQKQDHLPEIHLRGYSGEANRH